MNLEDRYFKIIASKTAAGIRAAPIAEKFYPFFEYWYNLNDCEYLLSTQDGEHFKYRNYYDSYWMPLIDTLGMKHRPHDTRHTCISMLTVAGVSDKVIKKFVEHKGQGVTEIVYTHFEIEELIDAINKIYICAMNRTEYKNNFGREHYERINLAVPKGMKDIIKALASDKGMSVNAYIYKNL